MTRTMKTPLLAALRLAVAGILIMVGTTASAQEPTPQPEPQPAGTQPAQAAARAGGPAGGSGAQDLPG